MAEENGVENEHLDACFLVWINWLNASLHYCNCTFGCCIAEIGVDFVQRSVSLCSLDNVIPREVFDDLVFFIPISNPLWFDSIEWVDEIAKFVLLHNLISSCLVLESQPTLHWDERRHDNRLLSPKDLIDVLLKIFAKLR